jgi:hypothetical protein
MGANTTHGMRRTNLDKRTIVEAATDRLHTLVRKTGEQIIEIGRELIAVKDALPHGQFGLWLESEFGWSQPTASRFVSVAKAFDSETIHVEYFEATALYALASGQVPESIRAEFVDRAEAGERITHKAVKDRLARP